MDVIAIVLAMILVAGFFIAATIVKNTYVCSPNEVLIFSGRRFALPDAAANEKKEVGFRVVRGGRAIRLPIVERVDRMSLTNIPIELGVKNAFSRGGIPLNVVAVANIKFPSEEPLVHNALERFLGCTEEQIIYVAKDTLEGNLRGVIAELTPEEINQKKQMFQQKLVDEAHRDMQRLGLVLDNLQIQSISDDVGYLTSVGRVRGAEVRKHARIGEVRAQVTALVQKAHNGMNSEIAKIDAETRVASKEMDRRKNEALTQRAALIAEARGQVLAQVAEAKAQVKSWEARAEQIRRRLEADVVAPAEAQRQKLEAEAKALAAKVLADGKAGALALEKLAAAYTASGEAGRDALLVQKLLPVFDKLMTTIRAMQVDKLTVLGVGTAQASIGTTLFGANEQLKALADVDLLSALTSPKATAPRLAKPEPPKR
jgi:flotillin